MLKVCKLCNSIFQARSSKQLFCCCKCANTHNRNNYKYIAIPAESPKLAELVGIMLGDGFVDAYQVSIALNTKADREYIPYVVNSIKMLFPELEPKLLVRPSNGYTRIVLNSRSVVKLFNSYGIYHKQKYIPPWILNSPEYRKWCIRGLIDCEGSVGFKVYKSRYNRIVYRQLAFTNKNGILLSFVNEVFKELGLHMAKRPTKNIYLSNDKEINIYRIKVGFGNPKLEEGTRIMDYNTLYMRRGAGVV